MQSSIYKYIPEEYADAFVHEGAILFRALSYFRDYEDAQVRGDEFEGTRIHRPSEGLKITLKSTGEKRVLPHSFESAANEDDIFVFCLSTLLSAELAKKFRANTCIEIFNLAKFISGVRAALLRRPSIKNKMLVHGKVKYYTLEEPLLTEWALPERIVMSKLNIYQWQQEYRLAFAVNGAFKTENVHSRLVLPTERRYLRTTEHHELTLKIGSLAKASKIHHFSSADLV